MFKKAFVLLSFATLAACGPSQQPPADQAAAAAPPAAAAPAPAAEPAPVATAPAPGPSANDAELARIKAEQRKLQRQQNELAAQQAQAAVPPPPPACMDCGVVSSITPVRQEGQAGLAGGLGGAALGGLAGNQFGHGKGKTAMTVVGVLGGALAGAEVQKQVTATTVYQVAVNMETGGQRVVTVGNPNGLSPGARVHVQGNNLQPY